MKYYIKIILLSLIAFSIPAQAFEIDLQKLITKVAKQSQDKFSKITEDLYSAISYQDSRPPMSSTIIPLGFEIGINTTYMNLGAEKELKEIGFDKTSIFFPKLYGAVEIFNFNLSGTYMTFDKKSSVLGLRASYTIMSGNAVIPAVTVGINHTEVNGLKQLDASLTGADVRISKELPLITIYGGIGYSKANFKAKNLSIHLKEVKHSGVEYTVGGRFSLFSVANIGIQSQRVGKNNTYTMNVGIGF